nr:hypothetical protein [Tanacetum cinerariifolium]
KLDECKCEMTQMAVMNRLKEDVWNIDVGKLKVQLVTKEKSFKDLIKRLNVLKSEKESISAQVNTLEQEKYSKDELIKELETRLDSLQVVHAEVCSVVEDVEKVNNELMLKMAELKGKVADSYLQDRVVGQINHKMNRLSDTSDRLEWRDVSGNVKPFGVATVWDSLRYKHDIIPWFHVVWFSHCVPRFSFHLWLALHGKLITQDSLRQWDVYGDLAMICPLCAGQPDSHAHVFFECLYSMQVWDNLKGLAGLSHVASRYMHIVEYLISFAKRRSCKSVIAKLVLSASAYYLWQERNARLFLNQKRTVAQIVDVIKTSVRLKLLSCSFQKSKVKVKKVMRGYNIGVEALVNIRQVIKIDAELHHVEPP